jgi:hypothetical protein
MERSPGSLWGSLVVVSGSSVESQAGNQFGTFAAFLVESLWAEVA